MRTCIFASWCLYWYRSPSCNKLTCITSKQLFIKIKPFNTHYMWTTLWDKNGHIFTPWIPIIDKGFCTNFTDPETKWIQLSLTSTFYSKEILCTNITKALFKWYNLGQLNLWKYPFWNQILVFSWIEFVSRENRYKV